MLDCRSVGSRPAPGVASPAGGAWLAVLPVSLVASGTSVSLLCWGAVCDDEGAMA